MAACQARTTGPPGAKKQREPLEDCRAMDPFRQLQVLSLLVLALFVAPGAVPPVRPFARRIRFAALALYVAGGLAILMSWWLRGS